MGQSRSKLVDLRPPYSQRPFTIQEFCASLETFDLVLFSGTSVSSWLTRIFTASHWSHIGVVYKGKEATYLCESVIAADQCVDVLSGSREKHGVRLVRLEEKLLTYTPTNYLPIPTLDVAVIRFGCAGPPQLKTQCVERFRLFMEEQYHKSYTQSKLVLARAQLHDILGSNELDTREYFCSELVSEIYKAIGALPRGHNSLHDTPASILRNLYYPAMNEPVFQLGPEVYISQIILPLPVPQPPPQPLLPSPTPAAFQYLEQPQNATTPPLHQQQQQPPPPPQRQQQLVAPFILYKGSAQNKKVN